MPFDARDYTDALLVPRGHYSPEAPLIGPTYGQNLRNAYFVARHHGQPGGAWAAPYDEDRPTVAPDRVVQGIIANPVIVGRDTRWAAGHWTHGLCHVVIRLLAIRRDGTARFRLQAGNAETVALDVGDPTDIDLAPGSSAELRGVGGATGEAGELYEGVAAVRFENVALDDLVHLTIFAGAEDAGVGAASRFQVESLSFWLESIG